MNKLSININYCEQTIHLRNALEEAFLDLGARLHKILEGRLFSGRWETWEDYLADMRLTKTGASKLIRIYQVFVLEYNLPKAKIALIGKELAYDLTRLVKTRGEAMEWLERGETLKLEDIRVAMSEAKTGLTQSKCTHPNEITIRFCPDCRLRERIA